MSEISINPTDNGIMAIANEGGIIGSGLASVNGDQMNLESIHVIPGKRKSGIGKKLLKAMINWARDQGAKKIRGEFKAEFGDDDQAKAFYAKNGIEVTEDGELIGEIK